MGIGSLYQKVTLCIVWNIFFNIQLAVVNVDISKTDILSYRDSSIPGAFTCAVSGFFGNDGGTLYCF